MEICCPSEKKNKNKSKHKQNKKKRHRLRNFYRSDKPNLFGKKYFLLDFLKKSEMMKNGKGNKTEIKEP